MKVVDAVAKVLKTEGVEYLFAYPVNPIIEAAAKVDIRPIIVRQERIGLHMADAMSRITSGEKIGVFCMQMDLVQKMHLVVLHKLMEIQRLLSYYRWDIHALCLKYNLTSILR